MPCNNLNTITIDHIELMDNNGSVVNSINCDNFKTTWFHIKPVYNFHYATAANNGVQYLNLDVDISVGGTINGYTAYQPSGLQPYVSALFAKDFGTLYDQSSELNSNLSYAADPSSNGATVAVSKTSQSSQFKQAHCFSVLLGTNDGAYFNSSPSARLYGQLTINVVLNGVTTSRVIPVYANPQTSRTLTITSNSRAASNKINRWNWKYGESTIVNGTTNSSLTMPYQIAFPNNNYLTVYGTVFGPYINDQPVFGNIIVNATGSNLTGQTSFNVNNLVSNDFSLQTTSASANYSIDFSDTINANSLLNQWTTAAYCRSTINGHKVARTDMFGNIGTYGVITSWPLKLIGGPVGNYTYKATYNANQGQAILPALVNLDTGAFYYGAQISSGAVSEVEFKTFGSGVCNGVGATLNASTYYNVNPINNGLMFHDASPSQVAPASVSASKSSSSSALVTWTDSSSNENTWQIYRYNRTTGVLNTCMTTAVANMTSYTVSGLTAGTYQFFVRNQGPTGWSKFTASNLVTI